MRKLVATAKLRWRIERDYEKLKQELGLGHLEGRNWRGFHHHASLCIAAYGFLVVERCLFPPHPAHNRCSQPKSTYTYPACHASRNPGALPIRTERHNPHSIAIRPLKDDVEVWLVSSVVEIREEIRI